MVAVPPGTTLGPFPGYPQRLRSTNSLNATPFRSSAECQWPTNSTPAASVTNHRFV